MRGIVQLALMLVMAAEAWIHKPPLGLDVHLPVPVTNVLTKDKVAAGRRLFFDKQLSRDGTLACASCHDPKQAFSDGRKVARGINGSEGLRNAPALINRGYGKTFFWDGRASSLEVQALEPIFNPIEMGLTKAELERRAGMKTVDVAAALASFVRTIRSGDSRFDKYASGQSSALNAVEKAGMNVFRGAGGCVSCHIGPNFTDEQFHNTGVAWRGARLADEGRFSVSGLLSDRGAFKTPTLRDAALTGPYMHDGSIDTLEDVIEFYSEGGRANPYLDPQMTARRFTAEEKRALAAFLRALTGAT